MLLATRGGRDVCGKSGFLSISVWSEFWSDGQLTALVVGVMCVLSMFKIPCMDVGWDCAALISDRI